MVSPELKNINASVSASESSEIVVLSANTPARLYILVWRLYNYINSLVEKIDSNCKGAGCGLSDVAFSLQFLCEEENCRIAMVVCNFEDLLQGLAQYLINERKNNLVVEKVKSKLDAISPITVYYEKIDENSQLQELFVGTAAETLIDTLLAEQDFENLALYWVKGGKINWEKLFTKKTSCKVSLPIYSISLTYFEKQLIENEIVEKSSAASCSETGIGDNGVNRLSRRHVENQLLTIWKTVLGIESIGRYENFFKLGGDSKMGMHMISYVRNILHVDLPLNSLYDEPTVEKMSEKIFYLMTLLPTSHSSDTERQDQEYEEGIIR